LSNGSVQRVIALIPARGGSKGVPGKNLYPVAGKPLIRHTIEQALASRLVTDVVVSTDDDRIAAESHSAGAGVILRPTEISGDTASSESALLHALSAMGLGSQLPGSELVVFLQCTSPIRREDDIDLAIRCLSETRADSLLSVSPNHRFFWEDCVDGARALNYDYNRRPRRQEMKPQYIENGSIYVFGRSGFLKAKNRLFGKVALYRMDEDAAVDIDCLTDLKIADAVLRERQEGRA